MKKTLVLAAADMERSPQVGELIKSVVESRGGEFSLHFIDADKFKSCIGCFGCWVKTPGLCIHNDGGNPIIAQALQADTLVWLSPLSFGGYSSNLKILIDRHLPLILPYFSRRHGELHHKSRYARRPRMVGIGIQEKVDPREAELFHALVSRNAVNFQARGSSSCVLGLDRGEEKWKAQLERVFSQNTPALPLARFQALTETPAAPWAISPQGKKVLLVSASPKGGKKSNSYQMGSFFLNQMEARGWSSETFFLKREPGMEEKLAVEVGRHDLVVLAFPLYIDAMPYLVTRALEHLAAQPRGHKPALALLCNSGFPEASQCRMAVALVRQFAHQAGFPWAGALYTGSGEAVVGEKPLEREWAPGEPPALYLKKALVQAAADLDQGRPISDQARELAALAPIPKMSFGLWRFLFVLFGSGGWRQRAAAFGVKPGQMLAKPFRR